MPVRMTDGSVKYPTRERPVCPVCVRMTGKTQTGVPLRVKATRPTPHPQVFMRDYRCPVCGLEMTDEYVMPRCEDDYLSDEQIAARQERAKEGRNKRGQGDA